jgi:predicted nucleotide-binding protein
VTPKSDKGRPQGECNLRVSREEARTKLEERIAKGRELLARPILQQTQLQQLRQDYRVWDDFNAEYLGRSFTTDDLQQEYCRFVGCIFPMRPSLEEQIDAQHGDISLKATRLLSIIERLELIREDVAPASTSTQAVSPRPTSTRVFLVHGRDAGVLGSVEAFLRKLGLAITVLKDEPNKGQTIIEKVESNAEVGFAVVLLTGDDEGHQRQVKDALLPRARQNVIFELGYFIGLLGRSRVCALYENGIELPSDYSGVTFISWSQDESWKFLLLRELKAAGLPANANDVF